MHVIIMNHTYSSFDSILQIRCDTVIMNFQAERVLIHSYCLSETVNTLGENKITTYSCMVANRP